MAQSVRRFPALTLNTDGRPHPRENTLLGITVVFGLVAFISSGFYNLHLLSSWTGLGGIVTGLWAQFISVTTAERFVIVIALAMSVIGFGLGLAHGGLYSS